MIACFRNPVTETALVVLPARQNAERVFELFIDFGAAQSEVGFIRQHQSAKRAAGDLFAATVGKIFQVSIETARESERQRRNGRVQFAKLRMHLARDRDVDLVFEAAAVDLGHVRRGRPHAERRASLCFLAVTFCDESNFTGAEFVIRSEFEDRGLLAAFSDAQCLRRPTRDRQLLIGLRAQFDFRIRAGTVHVVRNGHAGFEFIAGRGKNRHAWRDDKRTANQRVALGRPDRVVRNGDRHDL